jgi:hypothetical protein
LIISCRIPDKEIVQRENSSCYGNTANVCNDGEDADETGVSLVSPMGLVIFTWHYHAGIGRLRLEKFVQTITTTHDYRFNEINIKLEEIQQNERVVESNNTDASQTKKV